MSRIVGDTLEGALVAGPEAGHVPEYVTVRLTRGQVEALISTAEMAQEKLEDNGYADESAYVSATIASIRAQIGGAQ